MNKITTIVWASSNIKHTELKKDIRSEYTRRMKKILKFKVVGELQPNLRELSLIYSCCGGEVCYYKFTLKLIY